MSWVLRQMHTEVLVHTGQHYDENMSAVFFAELGRPQPDVNLGVGSGSHGAQTAAMLAGIEHVLEAEKPDWVLVYGDTNSTLAGALAAAKLHIPVAHVEAGLRSFNRAMPEEINRVLTDHIADLLFCPSQTAVDNLEAEGITRGVHLVGDVMADALLWAAARARTQSAILEQVGVQEKSYLLATVHRAENTDDPARLRAILDAFAALDEPIVFPVHPRTRKCIEALAPKSKIHCPGRVSGYGAPRAGRPDDIDRFRRHPEGSVLARRAVRDPARRDGMGGDGAGRVNVLTGQMRRGYGDCWRNGRNSRDWG